MYRILCALLMLTLSSNAYAQSVEERLEICIESSLGIITYAKAMKNSLEEMGERVEPFELADVITSTSVATALSSYFLGMIESEENYDKLLEAGVKVIEPLDLQNRLITEMIEEAFEDRSSNSAMADYISQCQYNFDGETYSLQDKINELSAELESSMQANEELIKNAERAEEVLNLKHKSEILTILEPYKQRIDTLCLWMKTYNHLDVLQKEVYVSNKFYDLCDKSFVDELLNE